MRNKQDRSMALDAHYKSNPDTYIPINDTEYGLLHESIQFLYQKTGFYIDQYKDIEIHPAHLKILVDHAKSKNIADIGHILIFFEKAICDEEVLCFLAD
jgi:hypothetical protein